MQPWKGITASFMPIRGGRKDIMTHKMGNPCPNSKLTRFRKAWSASICLLFQANPHTVDTVDGLARRLHRLPDEIRPALDFLSRIGVLQKANYGRLDLFWLNKGEMINSFFNE